MTLAADRLVVLGIRHHGPGSARSVVSELERVQPAIVLIEGPSDADPLVALAADPELVPPVALLAYAADKPTISAFWPFAVFSPEWQALRWAAEHGVPARFCDLPASAFLAGREREDAAVAEEDAAGKDAAEQGGAAVENAGENAVDVSDEVAVAESEEQRHGIRTDPIGALAEAAGYDDAERWWEDMVESRSDGVPPFAALTEAMAELRLHFPEPTRFEAQREARREAQMRQSIRAALKQTDGPVAVVCGAWHAPALTGKLPPATADAALLRGLPKRKTSLTWVPWTHSRLANSSGYGAGITSPGWYHHLFTAPDRVITRWLTKVAGVLRERDLPVSSAHVIEAVRLAEALATLRGRPLAGLMEVTEATRAVLCEGDDTAVEYVQGDLVVGELLGQVPESAPTVPFEVDLRAQLKTLRLKLDPLERTLALDLRKDYDRTRSVLFHRLQVLGIPWSRPATDAVQATGTFRETWAMKWLPDFSVAVVDAALWGTTVAGAADARLVDRARRADDLAGVTGAVELALLAELTDALPPVLAVLDEKAAVDLDVVRLMAAVPALVRAIRYGDVRGTDTAALTGVVEALVIRVCAGLPAAVTGLSAESAADLRTALDALHDALGLHEQTDAGPRQRWIRALTDVAGRRDVHGLLAGRVVRILVDAGVIESGEAATRFAAHLSIGVPPAEKAAWAEGFLSGSGLVLVHDPALLGVLDGWVTGLSADDFMDVLPLLRRAFGEFSPPERAHIADGVKRLGTGVARVAQAEDLDPQRAAGVVRTVASILGGVR